MISEPEAYRAYFERYVPKRCRLFGEITPSYSLLPVAGFEDVARRFNEVKVIFLMRDPVERVYSQLRMHKRNGTAHSDGEAAFLKALEDPVYLERGYYHKTLTRLYSVFSRDRVFTGFYENLFSDAEVARLCDFLGIPFQPGAYGKMINAAPERTALAPHLVAEARARFAEAYDFCFTEFGERVPESWRRD
ncbi:hypothetical protein FHS78_003656 [Parvibaculum indicum]|nr:sulfotransferase domain-containing protein [Parvibaculum indicum]NIJ43342.1 hypothetical protein [Parvibaculum indicum]